jgi:phosphatidylglycerol---prolipoprotein diacylglyceryl transferase
MLTHPQIDPIIFSIGPIALRWYGLMYVIAFFAFIWLGKYRARKDTWRGIEPNEVDDLLLYGVVGVVLGGRLGFILFYQPEYYLAHPIEILKTWAGGMSFHGGFLGVVIALTIFCWRRKKKWLTVMDFIAPCVPTGLLTGRIGNFINGELPGRATDASVPWGMWYQHVDKTPLARHPSSLYQALTEGVILFMLMWWFSSKPRPRGAVCAMFAMGYGTLRFITENFREPDAFLGLLAMNLSMGQWLCVPMIIVGVSIFAWSYFVQPKTALTK